jgi:hypothetical protein
MPTGHTPLRGCDADQGAYRARTGAGRLVEACAQGGEGMGGHRVHLVHGALRDDAAVALPRWAEPVGRSSQGRPQSAFYARTMAFAKQYKVGEDRGVPIVQAAGRGATCILGAHLPVVPDPATGAGQEYMLHMSALDVNHGFSLYPSTSTSRSSRLRLRVARNADGLGRLPHHLQRVLRHRSSHDGRSGDRGGREWQDGRRQRPRGRQIGSQR